MTDISAINNSKIFVAEIPDIPMMIMTAVTGGKF
jgi:hypothetical protein